MRNLTSLELAIATSEMVGLDEISVELKHLTHLVLLQRDDGRYACRDAHSCVRLCVWGGGVFCAFFSLRASSVYGTAIT